MSFGGGVQSTAMLVLAARREIDFPVALFANVGDDSENPATLEYVRDIAMSFASEHGIELHELRRVMRDGSNETLYGRLTRPGGQSLSIPVRMASGAPAGRACTVDFKIKVIAKWLKAHGASVERPAVTALGISLDEYQRMRTDSGIPYQTLEYPLIDLRLTRQDCVRIIQSAGLPVPPKSSCWFCPYHRLSAWRELQREQPDLFARATGLEDYLNARRQSRGQNAVYFSDRLIPLRELLSAEQMTLDLDEEDACESGYCMV